MKAKLFEFSPVMFASLFRQGSKTEMVVIENGLPEDAVITGFHHVIETDILLVRVESETFEDILTGNKLPIAHPIIFRDIKA